MKTDPYPLIQERNQENAPLSPHPLKKGKQKRE